MGFTFNGKHSDEFNFIYRTTSMELIPNKKQKIIAVPGRDGGYVYEGNYDFITITIHCTIIGNFMEDRRYEARKIAAWLSAKGPLILDHEADKVYTVVKIVNGSGYTLSEKLPIDTFEINFVCMPMQHQTYYNDDITWDNTPTPWGEISIPWDGYKRKFEAIDGETLTVINSGTYKTKPVIILTGNCSSITIGDFTYTNLDTTIYVDCANYLVYTFESGKAVNKMTNFTGNFPELDPGENNFTITCDDTDVIIEFDYKNCYI